MKMPCLFRVVAGYPECGGADFPLRPNYIFASTIGGNVPAPFQIDQVYGTAPVRTLQVSVRFAGPLEALAAMAVGDLDLELASNPYALGARIESLGPPEGSGAQAQRPGVGGSQHHIRGHVAATVVGDLSSFGEQHHLGD